MGCKWIHTSLGEVMILQRGFDLPETERKPGPYPVIASTGSVGSHCEAMVQGPGVVIGRSGSLGGGQFIKGDFWPLNTTLWVKDFKGNERRFCYYLLRSLNLAQFNAGSGVPTLNRNHIHPLPVRVPTDFEEQRAIAHILGTLDDKIELNRKQNETLEAMARALFKAWFVDFEPVRAKMEGRWRRGQSLPGMPAHLYDLFPDRLVESELGEIPEGWQKSTLAAIASLNPETWTTQKHPDEVHYIDLSNVKDGVIEAPTRYSWGDAPSRARRVLQQGDTIIGTVRPGNRSFALINEVGLTGSTGFAVLRPLTDANREFLYLAATNDDAIERLAHLADGAAYPAVRSEVVVATEIVMPSEEVMAAFSTVTKTMIDLASVCKKEIKVLAGIRDLLLPRLISGKLRVSEAEEAIAEAMV